MYEEDFQAERKSRAEAVGKMDDMRKECGAQIEELKKALALAQEHLEAVNKEHKDYQEKIESELVAKATEYYVQIMSLKEQVNKY